MTAELGLAAAEIRARKRDAEIGRRAELVLLAKHGGPFAFGRIFVAHLVSAAPSPLHAELNRWHLRETRLPPGQLDAFAAPRGHGKSTAGVEVPALWHAAYCSRRYVVIASDTWSQAVRRLETIRTEVETNEELRAAFPKLRPARDLLGNVVAWRDDEIALECGCRIVAVGAGKSIRGAKAGEHRPDLLLLDDLEDEASVATPGSLEKRLRWITRTALALAGPLRGISALWVGTILSRAALLNLATGAALDEGQTRPEWARPWTPHVFRAELTGSRKRSTPVVDAETGAPVLTPDGDPLTYEIGAPLWKAITREQLASIRYKVGAASYAAEYLSDPVDDLTKMLAPPRRASYVNPTAPPLERIVRLPSGQLVPVATMTRAAALDPQYADEGATDPDLAAVAIVGQAGALTFLLDSWIGRDRHGQASRLVELGTRWGVYAARVEANAAQVLTADAAAQLSRLPIVAKASTGKKEHRALGLAVRLGDRDRPETCRVFALPDVEDNGAHGSLLDYLDAFPNGRYDDPVDAVVMALELAAHGEPVGGSSSPVVGGERRR